MSTGHDTGTTGVFLEHKDGEWASAFQIVA
jgi:hypothetical protein